MDEVLRSSRRDYLSSSSGFAFQPSNTFSPLDLFSGGRQGLWYNPSDLSSQFQVADGTIAVSADNDPVAYIADKSLNGHAGIRIVDDTTRPTYKTDGTHSWLQFDGGDGLEAFAALGLVRNVGYATVIAAVMPTDDTVVKQVFAACTNSGNRARCNMRVLADESFALGGRRDDADGNQLLTGSILSTVVPSVISGRFRWATSDLIGRINGVDNVSTNAFQTDGLTSDTDSNSVRIGHQVGNVEFFNGRIYGIICVVADLTDAELLNAERWLADKAGIAF